MTLIKKKEDEFYSPWPRIAAVSLVIALLGTILFTILYLHLQIDWIESLAITFFTTSYHIVIRLLSPLILSLLFHHKYNYQIWWFQPKTWEAKLYKGLKVKQWKRQVMVFAPSQFSLEIHSIQEVINNMCHAELVHELIMLFSILSILFTIPFGALPVFLITAICATLFDSMFVMIQRYNRPRLVRIYERQNK